jgi:hypothetical protein
MFEPAPLQHYTLQCLHPMRDILANSPFAVSKAAPNSVQKSSKI